jgi:hypothetical protein
MRMLLLPPEKQRGAAANQAGYVFFVFPIRQRIQCMPEFTTLRLSHLGWQNDNHPLGVVKNTENG